MDARQPVSAPRDVERALLARGDAERAVLARGSLFLRRDLSEQALRQPAAPPEPVFSQRELAEARAAGFREGHASGLAAGHAAAEAARVTAETRALEAIAAALAAGGADAARIADQAAGALAGALVAAMRAVMPELIRRSALGETGAMLAHVIPGLSREPRVLVEVPRAIAPGVAAALGRLAPERRERIEVAPHDGLASGEARIRWAGGHARRRPAELWRAVLEVLEPALDERETRGETGGETGEAPTNDKTDTTGLGGPAERGGQTRLKETEHGQ